jgi:peptidoglycan/xylan/chitin deacetylase (PgdA/CDA1 family)
LTEIDDTSAGAADPAPPDEDAQALAATAAEPVADAGLPDVALPPVPEGVPLDDDIAGMYERAERGRARAAAGERGRGRAWWPPALAVLLTLLVLCGLVWTVADVMWRKPTSDPVAKAPAEDVVPAASPTETVTATESVEPTLPIEAGEPTGPVSVSEAIAAYALPFPDPPAVEPTVIKSLKPQGKLVAITIDDGIPFDTRMLDLFEEYDMHGTAFVLGTFARSRPELLRRMVDGGWEIANHSWDHGNLRSLSEGGLRAEFTRTQEAISAVTGNQAPYMRPPGGAYDRRVEKVAAEMGYRVVMWNRSLADTSRSATTNQLYRNAVDGVKPGDIILCHWSRPHTYEAMRRILPELKRRGFTVVSISELIADSGGVEALP